MSTPSHPLNLLAQLLVMLALTPVVLIMGVAAIYDDGPYRLLWAAAAITGALGVGGAAWTLVSGVRLGAAESRRLADARSKRPSGEILARWALARDDSSAFAESEWRQRKIEVVSGAAGLVVLGTLLIGCSRGGWGAGLATGVLLGGLYLVIGLAKYGIEYTNATGRGGNEVILTPDAIYVLGTWHTLVHDRWLRDVRVDNGVLVFDLRWMTRKGGEAGDEVRVPVPADRLDDAAEVARFFAPRVRGSTPGGVEG